MNLTRRFTQAVLSMCLAAVGLFAFAGSANAAGETATIGLKMDPLKGGLFKEAFKPVNWQVETKINVPDGAATIEPMKESNLSLPGGSLTFNPDPSMPVCPDDKVNATTVSVPVETIIAACPNSVIGNGTAIFALAQQTSLPRDGVMIVFNGGLQKSGPLKGQPRIMVYAYSYDTEVGVYTEATLAKDGSLDFPIPVLTADSSVTSLNLAIPGVPTTVDFPAKGITANLPAGQDPNYAQAKCPTGSWDYAAEFVLGDRPEGLPPGPTTTLNETSVQPCTGAAGKAKFAGVKVKGPSKAKRGKKTTYKVKIENNGTATAKKVKLKVTGKGVSGKASGGNIAPGKSKTIKVKVKFKKKGKIKTTFKATAAKTKAKAGKKKIKVK